MRSSTKLFRSFLLIIVFAPFFCRSQKPTVGIKLGLALSNVTLTPDNPPNTSTRKGILGGVYLNIPSGKKIIIRPGIEVVSKGAVLDGDSYRDRYSMRFTYVDFPINILYKTSSIKGHLLAGGGPSIGVPIKDFYSSYNLKTEFGVNGLIGYEVPIGVSLNLNYNYGLSNASKGGEPGGKISNRYLGITIGYSF